MIELSVSHLYRGPKSILSALVEHSAGCYLSRISFPRLDASARMNELKGQEGRQLRRTMHTFQT